MPEYWYVDLEADRVEIHRLQGDRYSRPIVLVRRDTIETPILAAFSAKVGDLIPTD